MTTVSSLSSTSSAYSAQRSSGPSSAIREGMKSLFDAAKSGDMSAVKSAYESLTKLAGSSSSSSTASTASTSSSSSSSSSNDPLSTLLSNLSSAVDSGDISQVRQAIESSKPKGGPRSGDSQGAPPPDGQGGQPPSEETMKAMSDLGSALQSGNVDTAKAAYTSLVKSLGLSQDDDSSSSGSSSSTSSSSSTASSSSDKFSELLSKLGSALNSGSLSTAQSLFSSLAPRGAGVDTQA